MAALSANLIWDLTKRDFSERFAGSILGAIWAFIWPLVNLFIYIVIFGQFMGGRLPGSSDIYAYSIYLSVGLIPWICFANSISRSSTVFLDKKHIISKIDVSLPSLLIFINLSETITFIITNIFLFAFLLATGYEFSLKLLLFPFIFFLQQILAFGLGLLSATLTVFLRDLKEVVGIILQLWFWFTPIVYVSSILPEFVKGTLVFSPAYIIIESYHRIFVFGDYPDVASLVILTAIAHFILFASYALFRVLEKDVRDFL
ncbi:MAG: ABC transporter permease [Desulfobacterales bacterium]|nr:ABC transporter permease [Desulfobacterales bacterium]MBU0735455.1 ABC transporter permease [Pseudomonadota bacterium]